jgi:hypothetical protein
MVAVAIIMTKPMAMTSGITTTRRRRRRRTKKKENLGGSDGRTEN